MSPEELKKLIEELKSAGKSDEEIAKAFLRLYVNGKTDLDDLKTLLAAVGFDINPEIEEILKNNPESVGLDKESKEKSESKEEPEDEEKSESKEEPEDEEKEWDKAKKYFHFNK